MKKHFPGFTKKSISLDDLPQRGKMGPSWIWRRKYKNNHLVEGNSAWFHVNRVLKNSIGKPFDEVFSNFCKKFPKSYQGPFLKEFEDYEFYRNRHMRPIDVWYVDDDRLIRINRDLNEYKGPYIIYSDDYKTEWFKKLTGEKLNDRWGPNWVDRDLYEKRRVAGTTWEFPSRRSPGFKKRTAIKQSRRRKSRRESSLAQANKAYSFLTKDEQAKIDGRELDIISRDRHGFGDESFKGSPYHGQQRKIK